MANKQLADKVRDYEAFLNEKLRTDLKSALEQRDALFVQISDYMRLSSVIDMLKAIPEDQRKELKTKVDLGCNFYCQARVNDPTKICVCIGYGFFLEMGFDEALAFIESKVAFLNVRAEKLTDTVNEIRANIKMVLEALKEIQNLQFVDEEQQQRTLRSQNNF